MDGWMTRVSGWQFIFLETFVFFRRQKRENRGFLRLHNWWNSAISILALLSFYFIAVLYSRQLTKVQNSLIPRHLTIHFPTSLEVRDWASEGMYECSRARQAKLASKASFAEQTNELAVPANIQASGPVLQSRLMIFLNHSAAPPFLAVLCQLPVSRHSWFTSLFSSVVKWFSARASPLSRSLEFYANWAVTRPPHIFLVSVCRSHAEAMLIFKYPIRGFYGDLKWEFRNLRFVCCFFFFQSHPLKRIVTLFYFHDIPFTV